jgi:DNA-binding NarL/FixJ family response regulator
MREGLRSCLKGVPNIEVVGEACNGEEAMSCVGTLQPQVVVMDINMPKMDGVTTTRLMTGRYPDVAVVGLSVTEDLYHKIAMERAGAFGVMTKGKQSVDELCREIEKAAATMAFISHLRKKPAMGRA